MPDLCVTCLAHDATDGLCPGCRQDLPRNTTACYRCGLPLTLAAPAASLICGECIRQPPAFTRAFIPWCYQFPVDRMIGHYKYRGQRHFVRPLLADFGALVHQAIEQDPNPQPQLLIPAPMHRKRQRKRGFNQAADIAETLSLATGIPWSSELLRRTRATAAQSGLDRRQRLSNLKGIFEVTGEVPAHVALVDDVVTTGATARTLAALLRQHGAQTVEIWALARTPAQSTRSGQSFSDLAGDSQTGS
ncbi:amidophosphoribosyltransferase [Marinobacter zhanjiangensis]|uniref:Amidophosphoribosyltransferase n=1 Tax=Marinobacter zhanjiangensis TaxID=578215 RepID=A0ABQ3B1Z0_9GAMM|nr:amidophosphoribosyltransferase [Marinobacter zhanjiangensis]